MSPEEASFATLSTFVPAVHLPVAATVDDSQGKCPYFVQEGNRQRQRKKEGRKATSRIVASRPRVCLGSSGHVRLGSTACLTVGSSSPRMVLYFYICPLPCLHFISFLVDFSILRALSICQPCSFYDVHLLPLPSLHCPSCVSASRTLHRHNHHRSLFPLTQPYRALVLPCFPCP